ncbi:MAG TPA: hypothetical protein VHD36_15430 [Pirellulales bacterium]|nr:hypothetical protein [Pirellulales bacterium]
MIYRTRGKQSLDGGRRTRRAVAAAWLALFVATRTACGDDYLESHRFAAPEATQAAAADERFVYAIANKVVAKYDRERQQLVARSTGEATHLNTGFFLGGKMYCAHSNFPQKPDRSDIKILDPKTMVLETFKDFGASDGSLTWAVFEKGAWWCNFAFYGEENRKTYLARLEDWREVARWTYPAEVVKAFGKNSASCGIWRDGQLLITGHDEREIFVLEIPDQGQRVLNHVRTVAAPFTGQGFAVDPVSQGLIGIDRAARQIVFAK